jgi:hypothetical protein
VRDDKDKPFDLTADSEGSPWFPRWIGNLKVAIQARGGNTEVASRLYEWVSAQDSFEDIICQDHWVPASPWMQGDDPEILRQRWIGEQAREDILVLFSVPQLEPSS